MDQKEAMIFHLYRVMGFYNEQKVQLTSNISSIEIAEKLMYLTAQNHPELSDLFIEDYYEYHF